MAIVRNPDRLSFLKEYAMIAIRKRNLWLIYGFLFYLHQQLHAFSLQESTVLERLILDAQGENQSKATAGTMSYRISHQLTKTTAVRFEATVRWDPDKAFSTFKASDPSSSVFGSFREAPIEEAAVEYMFQDKDQLYQYKRYTNTLFLNKLDYPRRLPSMYYMFDVYPRVLGSRCCMPHVSNSRLWSEMVGSNHGKIDPQSTIRMERISDKIIRQTRTDSNGATAITDFSLEFSGYPLRIEYSDPNQPMTNQFHVFEWQKISDATVLKRYRKVRGASPNQEKDALEIFEFEATSIVLSKSRLSFGLNDLKALLPKNAKFEDRIKNKKMPLNPSIRNEPNVAGDLILDNLAPELRKKGLLKP